LEVREALEPLSVGLALRAGIATTDSIVPVLD